MSASLTHLGEENPEPRRICFQYSASSIYQCGDHASQIDLGSYSLPIDNLNSEFGSCHTQSMQTSSSEVTGVVAIYAVL